MGLVQYSDSEDSEADDLLNKLETVDAPEPPTKRYVTDPPRLTTAERCYRPFRRITPWTQAMILLNTKAESDHEYTSQVNLMLIYT